MHGWAKTMLYRFESELHKSYPYLQERKALEEMRRESLVGKLMQTIMKFWKRTLAGWNK